MVIKQFDKMGKIIAAVGLSSRAWRSSSVESGS